MISSILFPFFQKLLGKYKKHGFTLAEALIITVMTGACLLPILGTMQNAQVRTENYDHQSKMQMFARSRLNAEIANAAFDHKSINMEDEYHYIAYFAKVDVGDRAPTEADASLIEFPRTTVTPEEIASLSDSSLSDDDLSQASKDLLGINSTTQHYFKLIHAYKTSVETKENPELAVFSSSPALGRETPIDTPKALLGIVVKTCLLYSNDQSYYEEDGCLKIDPPIVEEGVTINKDESVQVVPVTLFSFVNLPVISDEMIWLADAYNWKLYGIDPVGRTVSCVIDLPQSYDADTEKNNFRPWHIAVHPSLKFLAYQTEKYVFLVNIDRKSTYYKKTIFGISKGFDEKSKYGGIVFRPDGKYLFLVTKKSSEESGNDNKVVPLKVDYQIIPSTKTLVWINSGADKTPKVSSFLTNNPNLDTEKITGFVAGNDGYLYVSQKYLNNILRFPMYSSEWSEWDRHEFVKTNNKIYSIDISPDGNRLVVSTNKKYLSVYDTRDGLGLYEDSEIKSSSDFKVPFKAAFVNYSDSSNSISSTNSLSIVVNNRDATNNKYFTEYFYGSGTPMLYRNLKNSMNDKIRGWNIIATPDNKYVVINDLRKARVYFGKTGNDNSEDVYSSSDSKIVNYRKIETFDDDNSEESDEVDEETDDVNEYSTELVASKRDILAVALDKKIKLYDLNTFMLLDDEEFPESNSVIKGISMNSNGDMLLGFYNDKRKGYTRFNINDYTSNDNSTIAKSKKIIFDDRVPNMIFSLENEGTEAFYNIDKNEEIRASNWEPELSSAYNRKNFNLPVEWERLDMIGMPRGGAMVLYGKKDGSSMLEWIGRRNWKQDSDNIKDKYRLFARWTAIKADTSSFPTKKIDSISGAEIDSTEGRIVVTKEVLTREAPHFVRLKTGNKDCSDNIIWSSGIRYITPVIFKYIGGAGFNTYKIVDYADSLMLEPDKNYKDLPLVWQHNVSIDSNCRIGFWNGGVSSGKNGGVIHYVENNIDNTYYSDISHHGALIGDIERTFNTISDVYDKAFQAPSDGNKREYAIQFYWEKQGSDFPPLGSKKLAISPNQSTLAILATNTTNVPIVNFYDFNNQIYGPETQLEGMLVDYRKPKATYDNSSYCPDWPYETGNRTLFIEVADISNIKSTKVNSFNKLTTKNSYYWPSFINSPANINGTSSSLNNKYNKRFIGYIRPEYYVTKFHSLFTEDIRLFINYDFIFGKDYQGSLYLMPTPIIMNSNSYGAFLLQIDQSFSGYGGQLATFLSNNTNPNNLNYDIVDNHYYSNNLNDWEELKSEQTYILNNYPSFMGSFEAKTSGGGVSLGIDSSSMVFSRDKAKPILYLADKEDLWACYKQSLVRIYESSSMNNNTNLAISTDGQKLVIGTSNNIKAFNISTPDENVFKANTKQVISKSAGSMLASYTDLIASISVDITPTYLATKPYNSFNSSKTGGDYKLAVSITDNSFSLTNNSAVVASGGIYLINNNTKDIGVYNPINNPKNIVLNNNILKHPVSDSAITSYDDSIYIFGYGSTTPSNNVQMYNLGENKSLSSYDFTDSQTRLTPNSSAGISNDSSANPPWLKWNVGSKDTYIYWSSPYDTNYHLLDIYISNYSNGYYNNPSYGGSIEAWHCDSVNPWIIVKLPDKECVTLVKYCNYDVKGYIKSFALYGTNTEPSKTSINLSQWTLIGNYTSGTAVKQNWISCDFTNSTKYQYYLFYITDYDKSGIRASLGTSMGLTGFELYSSTPAFSLSSDDDYMTPMINDNLNAVNICATAVCSSPYGFIIAGGYTGTNATDTALLYWPHAINKFDGQFREFGISRSLTKLKCARYSHSLVWHKGKVYAIGGKNNLGFCSKDEFIECLNYNDLKDTWEEFKDFKYIDGASEKDVVRYDQGACSFGDEIFIFGGTCSDSGANQAIALNPESKTIRKLSNIVDESNNSYILSPCCAVPFGSKIYVIGMNETSLRLFEYTP